MAFTVFKEVGVRTREYISITENKVFGLPRPFVNKQAITNEHKAVLLYDEDERKIALFFTTQPVKYGIKVRIPNDTQGGVVVAGSFFDLKGIDASHYAGRYDFEKKTLSDLGVQGNGDAYVITLKEKETAKVESPVKSTATETTDDEPINLDDIPF